MMILYHRLIVNSSQPKNVPPPQTPDWTSERLDEEQKLRSKAKQWAVTARTELKARDDGGLYFGEKKISYMDLLKYTGAGIGPALAAGRCSEGLAGLRELGLVITLGWVGWFASGYLGGDGGKEPEAE